MDGKDEMNFDFKIVIRIEQVVLYNSGNAGTDFHSVEEISTSVITILNT